MRLKFQNNKQDLLIKAIIQLVRTKILITALFGVHFLICISTCGQRERHFKQWYRDNVWVKRGFVWADTDKCIGYFIQRVCTNNGAAFQCIFRCGYSISMRGYVRLSVRLSIAPSFRWSVGPSVGPLVRKTQFLTMTSLCRHPILSQLADRETDISYHGQGAL